MHNIFNGLFWFALPILLVVTNDIMAYVVGMTCGRKFIHRPFISFSPNKTWEGFIGGGIFTLIGGWYLARLLAQFTWLTCATNEFRLLPEPLTCQLDPIFLPSQNIFPPQMFEILPRTIIKMIPNIVEICMVDGNPDDLTNCVSGDRITLVIIILNWCSKMSIPFKYMPCRWPFLRPSWHPLEAFSRRQSNEPMVSRTLIPSFLDMEESWIEWIVSF